MAYELKNGTFTADNGYCEVKWYQFRPVGVTVRAVLVICHGKSEHIMRYCEFAEYLCENGIAVYGCDHPGHGDSLPENGMQGHFGDKEKTLDTLVENQKNMISIVRKKYPHLPLVLFGHSLGSFVVRKYMVTYPENIDGAIVCGTAGANKQLGAGVALLKFLSFIMGTKKKSKKIEDAIFNGYDKHFPEEGVDAWLTKDKEIRKSYTEDSKSGFEFSLGATLSMLNTMKEVNTPEWYAMVPQSLPVLLVSGEDDAVGDFGNGVREVYEGLQDAELCMVEMKLYEKDRHNILHETDREIVFADLLAFIEKVSEGVYAMRTYGGLV